MAGGTWQAADDRNDVVGRTWDRETGEQGEMAGTNVVSSKGADFPFWSRKLR